MVTYDKSFQKYKEITMVINETVSLWFGGIGTLVGLIGTGIAIYQWAIINEGNKRKNEFQYILAGIHNVAIQKHISWKNQISTLPKLESQQDWETCRLYLRARDDFAEISSLTIALEGIIDVDYSAISTMMDKSKDIVKKNNQLQSEGTNNPIPGKNDAEVLHPGTTTTDKTALHLGPLKVSNKRKEEQLALLSNDAKKLIEKELVFYKENNIMPSKRKVMKKYRCGNRMALLVSNAVKYIIGSPRSQIVSVNK